MASYYDLVLVAIPLALVGITATLYLAGLGLIVAVPTGAGVAGVVICHAMFVRGPVDRRLEPENGTEPVTGSPPTNAGSYQRAD
jgi:hypothetical protein